MSRANPLRDEIERAFPTALPAHLSHYDPVEEGSVERVAIEDAIVGRSWKDIPQLFFTNVSPFLLTEDEFLYLLPGFLIAAITNLDETLLVTSLLQNLKPPRAPKKLLRFSQYFSKLSPRQRGLVAKVMKYIRDTASYPDRVNMQIAKSLAAYWDVREREG